MAEVNRLMASDGVRRPKAQRSLFWQVSSLVITAGLMWITVSRIAPDEPSNAGVVVVPSADKAPAPLPVAPPAVTEVDRIAASEYNAARPPAGGPGPGDTRPPTLGGHARFEPVYTEGHLTAFRVRGSGTTVAAAGFHDGDLLLSVAGTPVSELPSTIGEAGLVARLSPGASVEIMRDDGPLAWRIGGKAE
ncbi:MAG: hypothetical protein V4564_02255 [Pseudomonadota bacterium]